MMTMQKINLRKLGKSGIIVSLMGLGHRWTVAVAG